MLQDGEKTTGSGKPFKRYLYLNKFTDYQQLTDSRIKRLEKKTDRILIYILVTYIVSMATALLF